MVALELNLKCLHTERATLYAERRARRINDEALRRLVAEIDMAQVSLQRRLAVALRTLEKTAPAPLPAEDKEG